MDVCVKALRRVSPRQQLAALRTRHVAAAAAAERDLAHRLEVLLLAIEDLDDACRSEAALSPAHALSFVEKYGREYVQAARALGSVGCYRIATVRGRDGGVIVGGKLTGDASTTSCADAGLPACTLLLHARGRRERND